jgi:hypothetical protein
MHLENNCTRMEVMFLPVLEMRLQAGSDMGLLCPI